MALPKNCNSGFHQGSTRGTPLKENMTIMFKGSGMSQNKNI